MSSKLDEALKSTLEAFTESLPKQFSGNSEISGWQESAGSISHSFTDPPISRYCKTPSMYHKISRTSARAPFSSMSSQSKSPRYNPKYPITKASPSKSSNPRAYYSVLPINSQKNKKSLIAPVISSKRKLRLHDFHEKEFIIVNKCLPMISGYSAIFYYK